MPLSWNEIRKRAIGFSHEWKDASRENSESQSFYNDFFSVFGISRRRVAIFEEPVKKLGDKRGSIDLFWKGVLLVEQKSLGGDLEKAYGQALEYFPNIKEEEVPRYVMVSDFQNFELYDLEEHNVTKFELADLHRNIEHYGFIAGYKKREFKDQDPANIEASEMMGKLHDTLNEIGYKGSDLELFLVRLLFCLFADDTGIFERDIFKFYLEERTSEDGRDLGMHIEAVFQTLNTPEDKRAKILDEDLAHFPYVNGTLFADTLHLASFDSDMRKFLIRACYFDWSQISPAIFGSLFQSVMDKDIRRGIGGHYTTEQNIMKIVKPLFLDDLYAEFGKIKSNKKKLEAFHKKIAKLRFFDPACGCGNFLIIAYRELRLLEIEILKVIYGDREYQLELDIGKLTRIDVDAFHGIEIEEFPSRIAEVALWLVDHQMNMRLSEVFGQYYVRIPLKKSPHIINENALNISWETVIPPKDLSYILGNPPFVGKQHRDDGQQADMARVFSGVTGAGVLDYVTAWYIKAGSYIQGTRIRCAFVSTNSITQGEQVGVLWNLLFEKYHVNIHFAHRTFAWGSEARGEANVHVVIIGFGNFDIRRKKLFDYETVKSDPHEMTTKNISPYLVEGEDYVIEKRTNPICVVPEIVFGNMPNDGGHLLFTDEEKSEFLKKEPGASSYLRPLLDARGFLEGDKRWCLWLVDANPAQLRKLPTVMSRINGVQKHRKESKRNTTKELAATPSLFGEIRHKDRSFVLVPRHSSEQRKYIPLGFFSPDHIAHDSCLFIPGAELFHFGILSSEMFTTWVRFVGGKIKSDYRISNNLVYNNFPWPWNPIPAQVQNIEEFAQAVLDARVKFIGGSSLADLYDQRTMPMVLRKAHHALDRAVDRAYRKQRFTGERGRMEFLFGLHRKFTAPLLVAKKKGRRKKLPLPMMV